jgi:hypothetical protein
VNISVATKKCQYTRFRWGAFPIWFLQPTVRSRFASLTSLQTTAAPLGKPKKLHQNAANFSRKSLAQHMLKTALPSSLASAAKKGAPGRRIKRFTKKYR